MRNYETEARLIALAQAKHKTYKSTDKGATGKTAEYVIRAYLNLKARNMTGGRKDLYKTIDGHKCSIEIKTTGGEVENYNNHKCDIVNNKYVIYAPCYDITKTPEKQFFVFNAQEFYNLMLEGGHLRFNKQTSNGYVSVYEGGQYNRASIKSFYHPLNLKPKQTLCRYKNILNICIENGTPLDEFITERNIKTATSGHLENLIKQLTE